MHGTIKRGRQGTSNFTRVCFAVGFLQIVALLLLRFRAPPVLHTPQLQPPGLCPCLLGQCRSGGANQGVHDDAVPTCSATAAKIRSPILVVVRPESGESLNKDDNVCHTIVRQTLPSLTNQTHWHHAPVNVLVILDPEAPPQQKKVIHQGCAKTNQDVFRVHTVSVPRNRLHTVSLIIHKHARKLAGVKYVAFVDLAVTHPASLASSALENMVLVLEGKHVDAATALASRYDTPATSTTTTIESKMRAAWLYAHYDGGPIMTRAGALRKKSVHIEQWLTAAHAADRYKALTALYHSHPCGARFTIPEILTRSRFADNRRDTRSHEHQNRDDDRACSPMPHSQQRRPSSPFRGLAHSLINPCFQHQQQQPSVLMILPWLEFGGADEFNVNLARELRKKGVNVVVTTTLVSIHPNVDRLLKYATDVFHIPHLVISADDQPGVLSLWEYVIATRRVELVFLSNSHLGYKMLPHLQTLKNKYEPLRIVDFVHLEEPEQGAKSHAASSVRYSAYLDHTFVASRHLAEWTMERRQRARRWRGRSTTHRTSESSNENINNKVSVAYIGVDTQALVPLSPDAKAAARKRYVTNHSTSSSPIVIAYVARMETQKDPGLFFEIARRLATRPDKFFFLAIGDGDLLPILQRNITDSGLNHKIKTFSMLHHDETMRLLASSDILLLPSRNEGISLATYEAMALGVVPVVTDVGGQCELVDEQVGACLPLTTRSIADDFAREITDNIVPRLSLLSAASRRRVEARFSLGDMMQSLTHALCASATRGSMSL
jgi:glycosyltransferase involved in cell wall biosynthesis